MAFTLPFLSIGPKVTVRDGVLKARSSIPGALLSLGTSLKWFEADINTRTIKFTNLVLFVVPFKSTVAFDDVREVTFKYSNLTPFADIRAADATDLYSVGIKKRDRSEILLFRWMGAGEFGNETILPDIMYWDDVLFDVKGNQKERALVFYEALKKMIQPDGDPLMKMSPYYQQAAPAPEMGQGAAPPPKPGVRPAPPPPGTTKPQGW